MGVKNASSRTSPAPRAASTTPPPQQRSATPTAMDASSSATAQEPEATFVLLTAPSVNRLVTEAMCMAAVVGAELIWWNIRGRFSLAPELSEAQDATRFVSMVTKWYVAARALLWAIGKAIEFGRTGGIVRLSAVYVGLLAAAVSAAQKLKLHKHAIAYIDSDPLLSMLKTHVMSQGEYFKSEGYLVLRLLALLVVWEMVLLVAYYIVTSPATIFSWLVHGGMGAGGGSGEEELADKEGSKGGFEIGEERVRGNNGGGVTHERPR